MLDLWIIDRDLTKRLLICSSCHSVCYVEEGTDSDWLLGAVMDDLSLCALGVRRVELIAHTR